VKNFQDKISEYLSSSPSISQLSSKTNDFFVKKYSIDGNGGNEKFSGNFIPGKIYVGKYNTDSKISEKIKWINRYPLFYFISEEKIGNEIIIKAIDLNITPPENRGQILEKIHQYFYQTIKENSLQPKSPQKEILLKSKDLEILLEGTGYKFSVTGFKKRNFSDLKVVDYEDWHKLVYLNISSVDGEAINTIYNNYRSKLNN
jgi:hypothetical protein